MSDDESRQKFEVLRTFEQAYNANRPQNDENETPPLWFFGFELFGEKTVDEQVSRVRNSACWPEASEMAHIPYELVVMS